MSFIIFIRDSQYGMPIVQSVHLVGLTVLLATVLVLNLRLAGVALKDSSLDWLARQLRPWMIRGLALVILSGVLIFVGTPAKYLASNPFRVKMVALGVAMLFQYGVLRGLVASDSAPRSRAVNLIVAALSLTLWFTVGWAGRAIAFIP
jgi:Family of unknown function (DUF6644)